MSLNYVLTSDSLCVYDGVDFVEVGRDHCNFSAIANKLADPDVTFEEIAGLSCTASSIRSATDGKVEVTDHGVFYKGELIHNSVVDAIYEYTKVGLPIDPIVKFLENLMMNSSKNSIDQLWRFIEHHKLPLTEDGHLLAYKAVKSNYKDKYSGSIDNSIGQVVKMDRSKISDNPDEYCSTGLHVGGLAYSGPSGWYGGSGDKCVIVKVNPKDVVCVPHDHNATKVRVCEYEVVKNYCDILKPTTYDCNYDECDCDDYECEIFEDEDELELGDICNWGDRVGEIASDVDDNYQVAFRDSLTRTLHIVDFDELTSYKGTSCDF